MENITEAMLIKGMIQSFLIGLESTIMIVFLIITIIDLKKSKEEIRKTDNWIKSIELQHKFESTMMDCINSNENRISNIEEKLGIKEEEKEDE